MFGREKAYGEQDLKRRWGYTLLGELHLPGRLRAYHILNELRALGLDRKTDLRVLDAGCGRGALPFHLARKFPSWRIMAVDSENNAVARMKLAQRRLTLANLTIVKGDLLALGMDAQFDLVICADVLEHIEHDDLAVKNLVSALRPGGFLIVTTPSIPQRKHLPTVRWRDQRLGLDESDYGHVRHGYSPSQMRTLIEGQGLRFERVRWTFGRFGTLMFDIFFSIGDNHPSPLVYATFFPFLLAMGFLDLSLPNRDGSAILAVGKKT